MKFEVFVSFSMIYFTILVQSKSFVNYFIISLVAATDSVQPPALISAEYVRQMNIAKLFEKKLLFPHSYGMRLERIVK